ncbi:MAG TPA: LysR substrate-binding domain-containing protein [Aliidongia sp.]|nr:LysR substrate-binding domain-containing protein [Aliidongia sp.]
MNLRDLSYLVALADLRHFGRAAEASNVSQPTLSGQIRKTEEYLGVTLVERDSRNVALTDAGRAIVAEARAALGHIDAIKDIARAHRDPLAGRFHLGMINSLGPSLAPELLTMLDHDAPRLEIELTENLTDPLLTALRDRHLDAALLATPPDGDDLTEIPLFEEPFRIALPDGHPLTALPVLTTAEIERYPLLLLGEGHCLRDQALSLCGARSVDARVRSASLGTLLRLVAKGRGITIVPALSAQPPDGLVLRDLSDPRASRRLRLVARRNYPRRAALDLIAAKARSIASSIGLPVL